MLKGTIHACVQGSLLDLDRSLVPRCIAADLDDTCSWCRKEKQLNILGIFSSPFGSTSFSYKYAIFEL